MSILAIDQGTTGTTLVVYGKEGEVLGRAYREIPQIYPQPGWVEHDPYALWQSVVAALEELPPEVTARVSALGITNQRETTIVWDRRTGKPVYNAIVWQCRRTADLSARLAPKEEMIRRKTGLTPDAYFSATKIRWILDRVNPEDREHLLFGNVDSWLIWNLTGGSLHTTDLTNASRTMLFNIKEQKWDEELLALFDIPLSMLPSVRPSRGDFGRVQTIARLRGCPILGVAGDQQASLFGQGCLLPGQVKNTYGTGSFIMMNLGDKPGATPRGLLTTLALGPEGKGAYALEGSVFMAGATLQFLRDGWKLIDRYDGLEAMAAALPDNGGVYFVPAFVGLGAPYWDMEARGAIVGLTRGVSREHLIRAALEAMAYQTLDVLTAMESATGVVAPYLLVDGGAARNRFLLQFQADILNKTVKPWATAEATSLGVAFLAGLEAGFWSGQEEISRLAQPASAIEPKMGEDTRRHLLDGWQQAVRQTRTR
jgi:glycerol kinase